MNHELSIAFQTDKRIENYPNIAKKVENAGFDCITVYNDMLYQPAWLPLFQIAKATDQIKLGVAAVNPYTSHPINIAGNIALLSEISKGRAYLGLARGAWLDFIGIYHNKPISTLRESFEVIQYLLSGDTSGYRGEIFSVKAGDTFRWQIPNHDIPYLLGTWGKKTATACFPFISMIKLGGTANPDMVSHFSSELSNIKKKHKFKKDLSIVAGAVCVVDEDGDKARELARKEVALYLPVIASLDSTLEIEDDVLQFIQNAVNNYDFDKAAEGISDDLLSKFAFVGTPDEIIEQSIDLIKAGTYRVEYGTPHGISIDKGIDLLASEVLPGIRQEL